MRDIMLVRLFVTCIYNPSIIPSMWVLGEQRCSYSLCTNHTASFYFIIIYVTCHVYILRDVKHTVGCIWKRMIRV